MRSSCENEHVRNLANFDALIAKIVGFGKYYSPVKGGIKLEALSIVSQNAKAAITNFNLLNNQYLHTVSLREVDFDYLKILNQKLCKVLQLTANISETEMYMLVGSANVACHQFTSQERYDFLLHNFCKIIKLLKANPPYSAGQDEIKMPLLDDFYASIYLKNNQVKQCNALLSNARLIRDEVMYREHNGLVALSDIAKTYIKYHYGSDSIQYKQVRNLVIKRCK